MSGKNLGSNKIYTDLSSNQRAAEGGNERQGPHCVYFRQHFQHGKAGETRGRGRPNNKGDTCL